MAAPTAGQPTDAARIDDGAFRIVVVLSIVLALLIGIRLVAGDGGGAPAGAASVASGATPSGSSASAAPAPVDVDAYLEQDPKRAPPLALEGPDGPVSLAALRGQPVLVFFGYTHCPDVCPATIGTVGMAIDASTTGARAILVSVDPERDTPDWLAEFVRFMPTGFSAVSGSPEDVRTAADAWGVRYARVATEEPGVYLMSHTADVFLVDRDGLLRARFPFGTEAATMTAVLAAVDATPVATAATGNPSPSSSATPAPAADVRPQLVSSSVWSGGSSPLIFTMDDGGVPQETTVQLFDSAGDAIGEPHEARPVQPEGIAQVSYVATLDIPSSGPWQVGVMAPAGQGVLAVTALDPGGTAPLGAPAPTVRTQRSADVDSLTWLTTDPLPDPRLYATSTADTLADHTPFVFVVDSYSFKITPQCGQAVIMAKQLVDRWRSVPFIHHEPYRYTVVTTEPVLEGTIDQPRLTDVAAAWGVGEGAWGVESMPWIFVVDGDGLVRAKYQGIIGTADVDVLLTYLPTEKRTALWPIENGPVVPSAVSVLAATVAR